jgi:hypothetical protein
MVAGLGGSILNREKSFIRKPTFLALHNLTISNSKLLSSKSRRTLKLPAVKSARSLARSSFSKASGRSCGVPSARSRAARLRFLVSFQRASFLLLRASPARLYRCYCDILDRVYGRCKSQDHRNSCQHACRPGDRVSTYPHTAASFLTHPFFHAERGKMVGIFYAAPLLGPSLGPLLGGVLAQAFSWRATMWLLAAILGIDLVLFTLFFRDTFRRKRSLTYRCAVARHQSTIVSRTVRARDTINSREKTSLGDGSTSRSSSCGTAAGLDDQPKIALSLAEVNPFPPLLPVLRRRNNVTTLFPSGSTHLPPLQVLVHSLAHQDFSLHLASPSHSRALEHSPMRMTTTLSRPGSFSSPSAAGAYSVACSEDVGLTGSCVG